MDEIRVFPRRTKWTPVDGLAFVGEAPLPFMRPDNLNTPVRVSVTFTWDLAEGKRLMVSWRRFYADVRLGGPVFGQGGEFVPGRFLRHGVTITSRGCPRHCPWCFVPQRFGPVAELPIRPGWIVQDDNLLACSAGHVQAVFDMLSEQPQPAAFSGGLDARLLTDWHRDRLEEIRLKAVFLSCDSVSGIEPLKRAARILEGMSIEKRRCYVLIGHGGETLDQAERRLESVYALGFLPFAQLYQGAERSRYPPEWKALARKWSRPAAYRSAASAVG